MRNVTGQVEAAVRSTIAEGESLPTPTGRAEFVVSKVTGRGVVLELGKQRTATSIAWSCLEGAADFLRGRSWIPIGSTETWQATQAPSTIHEEARTAADCQLRCRLARAGAGVVELSDE